MRSFYEITLLAEAWNPFAKKKKPTEPTPPPEPEESPEERLARWKELWRDQKYPHGHVYHPDFDWRNPRAEEGAHGTFTVGYDGERFRLMSPYHPTGEMLKQTKIIMDFSVSMPGYMPGKKPGHVKLYGNPEELGEQFGVHGWDFMNVEDDTRYDRLEDRPEGWYYGEMWHSELSYGELVSRIRENWRKHGVRFSHPMPDYKDRSLTEDIMDVVFGSGHSGFGTRHDFTYPDPKTVK